MKKWQILRFFLPLFFSNALSVAADLSGTIKLKSPAPKRVVIRMNSDPVCIKQNGGKVVHSEEVVTSDKGNLANVFVYIREGIKPGTGFPEASKPVLLDQKGCTYIPHVWGVAVNQTFTILNSDPTLHNVHSLAKNNPNFNTGMATVGQKIEKKFTKPEVMIKIKCDVHGWMNTYVGVMDHPYFGVTDLTGGYSFKNLPPGDYTVVAWQEKLGEKTQKVTLSPSDTSKQVDFAF